MRSGPAAAMAPRERVERLVPRRSGGSRRRPAGGASGARAGRGPAARIPTAPAAPRRRPAPSGRTASAVLTSSSRSRVVHRCTPSMVQSCRPATPSAQPSHTPLVSTSQAYFGWLAVDPGHLGHVAVVVRLLVADAVGRGAHPQVGAQLAMAGAPERSRPPSGHVERPSPDRPVDAARLGRRRPARAHRRSSGRRGRSRPAQPGPPGGRHRQRRRRAHRHDGREPGGPRLLHDLERGPAADVQAQVRRPGSRPSSSSRPTTLSTALWRPTSSRTSRIAPVAVERGGGVHRAGARRTDPGRARTRSGTAGQHVERDRREPACSGSSRSRQLVERRRAAQPARRRGRCQAGRRHRAPGRRCRPTPR